MDASVFSRNAVLTDRFLQLQAKKFAGLLNISEIEFKTSQGWIDRFKKRHDIRRAKIHGESEIVPVEDLPEQRQQLIELLSQYQPEDVLSCILSSTGLITVLMQQQFG